MEQSVIVFFLCEFMCLQYCSLYRRKGVKKEVMEIMRNIFTKIYFVNDPQEEKMKAVNKTIENLAPVFLIVYIQQFVG